MESKWPKMRRIPASQREIAVENMISEMKVFENPKFIFLLRFTFQTLHLANMDRKKSKKEKAKHTFSVSCKKPPCIKCEEFSYLRSRSCSGSGSIFNRFNNFSKQLEEKITICLLFSFERLNTKACSHPVPIARSLVERGPQSSQFQQRTIRPDWLPGSDESKDPAAQ